MSNPGNNYNSQIYDQKNIKKFGDFQFRLYLLYLNLLFFRQSQNKEITVLRSKLVENESDFERVKRQLTNERFEREKCVQELRKYQDSSINNELVSRYTSRCHSPIKSCSAQLASPVPMNLGCGSSSSYPTSGGAAAAVAAARAAIDASNHTR